MNYYTLNCEHNLGGPMYLFGNQQTSTSSKHNWIRECMIFNMVFDDASS